MSSAEKVKEIASKARLYWKTPPPGKYMSFKEIAALAGGGFGVKFIITCVLNVMIAVGNVFIGNTIGVEPMPMYAIYILSVVAGFPLTMLRAYIIDNTRGRKGKYRPYIVSMGLPTVLLSIGYFWAPYELMSQFGKCVVVLLFNIGFQFFYNFLYDAYDNYIVVLSPDTQERSNVASIRAVADSLAPTITGAIIPILGKAITGTNNLFDIRIYRYIWPPILIFGFCMSLIVYAHTEEKIVQAKTHAIQIKFIDALRAVAKNKYFWIISLAGWLGFLEGSYGNILGWLYTYRHACSDVVYAVITTVYGNASFWGMLLAPYSIKRFGKKNTLIVTNLLNVAFIAMIYPLVKLSDPSIVIWLVMGCLWLNALVGSFAHILNPSLNGDIRDYQQYITGERIDGMFAAVGLIGSAVTMVTSSVLPAIYERAGINKTKLAELLPAVVAQEGPLENPDNVYNVLYHGETFMGVFAVLIGASVIGAVLNVLPYFWYDLSEVKQRGMIKVLRLRALFEDYGNGVFKDKDLVEAVEIIREANELVRSAPKDLKKYRAAKKAAPKGAAKKEAKKAFRKAAEFNRNVEISKFVVREINRFKSPLGRKQLKDAEEIVARGYSFADGFQKSDIKKAKALPKETPEQKEYRKYEISATREILYARRAAKKYFPDGIKEFDVGEFEVLFSAEDELAQKLEEAYLALYKSKDDKNKAQIKINLQNVKDLKAKRKTLEAEIKRANNENSVYNRAAKPYVDAKKLLKQNENYAKVDEIYEKYEDAKARRESALAKAEADRIEAPKKAYGEKSKAAAAEKGAKKKTRK